MLPEESEAELDPGGNMQVQLRQGILLQKSQGKSQRVVPPHCRRHRSIAGSSAFDPESQAKPQPEQVFSDNDEDGMEN